MTIHHQDPWLTVHVGDCRAVLAGMEAGSVHAVVTSPPYFGLRDYGAEGQLGLESTPEQYVENMVAVFREVRRVLRDDGTLWLNLGDSYHSTTSGNGGYSDKSTLAGFTSPDTKGRRANESGARRRIDSGLKPKDLVGIPWMVARALQAPYYTGRIKSEADRAWLAGWLDGEGTISFVERDRGPDHTPTHDVRVFITNTDREPLDYFAGLTAGHVYQHEDGRRENRYGGRPCYRWQMGTHDAALLLRELYPYLRTKRQQAALVWTLYQTLRHKNGHARTPDAVVARRREIADMVRALNAGGTITMPAWVEEPPSATEPGWYLRSDIIWSKPNPMPESVSDRPTKAHEYLFLLAKSERYYFDADAVREPNEPSTLARHGGPPESPTDDARTAGRHGHRPHEGRLNVNGGWTNGRNIRSVWTIATQPYPGAHFATFPPKLVEPCILAGTSERGVCPECGAPWRRVVERTPMVVRPTAKRQEWQAADDHARTQVGGTMVAPPTSTTTGWRPTCAHADAPPVPATVLDPFGGSGTTAMVAQHLSRRAVLIDLNPDYIDQQLQRNQAMPLGLEAA